MREARLALAPDGTLDGTVHQVYTIAGRHDAAGCGLAQPNFAAEIAAGNVGFRIPTPLFRLGLVEAVPDINLRGAPCLQPLGSLPSAVPCRQRTIGPTPTSAGIGATG